MASRSNSEFESTYDIFLSFSEEDTRKRFTDHLYKALKLEGFHTFRDDDEICKGKFIKTEFELEKAIMNSRMSVIVLSQNYAESTACLFELQLILERRRTHDHFVLPVFFEVDPQEIKQQALSLQFGTEEEVKGWSAALKDVAMMKGMVSQNQCDGYEAKFIKDIVGEIRRMLVGNHLGVTDHQELEKNMQTLKMKLEYLRGQANDIEVEISSAESQPWKRRKKEVEVWLEDVQQLKDNVQTLEKEVVGEMNVFLRAQLGMHILEKIQEVQELQERGRGFNGLLVDELPIGRLLIPPTKDFVDSIQARNKDFVDSIKARNKDFVEKNSVYGLRRVGKKPIMKHLLNKVLEETGFQTRSELDLPMPDPKSREEKDRERLQLQVDHYPDATMSISDCESDSCIASEGGELSMENLADEVLHSYIQELLKLISLEELEKTPSNPRELEDLNCGPMKVPPTLSHHFSILHVLDLSYTGIKSLPQSISRLVALQQLILRSCELLMKLPPEIGELRTLEVLDLEGTEILCLPKEIAKLVNLTCLKVSFYGYAGQTVIPKDGYASQTVQTVIPKGVLSNLKRLIELIIDVTPYGKWWDKLVKDIIHDLRSLNVLTTLKLYLPTAELLEEVTSIFPGLANFRFTVGPYEEHFISRLPRDVEEEFNNWEKLEKGLKYVDGDRIPNEITKVFKLVDAFYLHRHWTAKSLTEFGHENINEVKFCLVMECNEFRTIIDSEQFYQGKDAIVLGSLERLIIRYLKNVESIWKGPVGKGSLSNLKSLVVFTCPNLTTLLTIDMLGNLNNLEELIVEDCPKIESLVSVKSSRPKSELFLPSLKEISLIDVPELVSISGGLRIAPKLERMVILYCPKLEKLSTTEVSSTELKVIEGQKEWWDALKWYESDLSTKDGDRLAGLFSQLRRDGDLMAQLTEDEISGYGQGKVGSFNIREELLEEIPSEELEEISSEVVGGFKTLVNSPERKKLGGRPMIPITLEEMEECRRYKLKDAAEKRAISLTTLKHHKRGLKRWYELQQSILDSHRLHVKERMQDEDKVIILVENCGTIVPFDVTDIKEARWFQELEKHIEKIFQLLPKTYNVRYFDGKNDLTIVDSDTLQSCFAFANQFNANRLYVEVRGADKHI